MKSIENEISAEEYAQPLIREVYELEESMNDHRAVFQKAKD